MSTVVASSLRGCDEVSPAVNKGKEGARGAGVLRNADNKGGGTISAGVKSLSSEPLRGFVPFAS